MDTVSQPTSAAPLPTARGPLSTQLIEALRAGTGPARTDEVRAADPYGDDLQLALYTCYELHYNGFAGVDDDAEWDPDVLAFRRGLERHFLTAVRDHVGSTAGMSAEAEMDELCVEPIDGDGVSYRLRDNGTWDEYRDVFVLRSLYQLKEADPHAWAIPRLRRGTKAAFVAVEFDEFGAGQGAAVHQELFADLMRAADLDAGYLAYLDVAPAWSLTPVNLMSYFGLHRSMRGAAVGHLAATEITSPPGSQRMLAGLERLDAPEACRHFYREHVEADAVHEQVMRVDVVGDLIRQEPQLESDVVFGIRGFGHVEDLFEEALLAAWGLGQSFTAVPVPPA